MAPEHSSIHDLTSFGIDFYSTLKPRHNICQRFSSVDSCGDSTVAERAGIEDSINREVVRPERFELPTFWFVTRAAQDLSACFGVAYKLRTLSTPSRLSVILYVIWLISYRTVRNQSSRIVACSVVGFASGSKVNALFTFFPSSTSISTSAPSRRI